MSEGNNRSQEKRDALFLYSVEDRMQIVPHHRLTV